MTGFAESYRGLRQVMIGVSPVRLFVYTGKVMYPTVLVNSDEDVAVRRRGGTLIIGSRWRRNRQLVTWSQPATSGATSSSALQIGSIRAGGSVHISGGDFRYGSLHDQKVIAIGTGDAAARVSITLPAGSDNIRVSRSFFWL